MPIENWSPARNERLDPWLGGLVAHSNKLWKQADRALLQFFKINPFMIYRYMYDMVYGVKRFLKGQYHRSYAYIHKWVILRPIKNMFVHNMYVYFTSKIRVLLIPFFQLKLFLFFLVLREKCGCFLFVLFYFYKDKTPFFFTLCVLDWHLKELIYTHSAI